MGDPIVVGVDGSMRALAAVEWAADDAARRRRPLRIVHACEPWAIAGRGDVSVCRGALRAAVHRARGHAPGLEIGSALLPGHPVEVLTAESAGADSVVLGSRGVGGFGGLVLGSVSLGVAGHADGPVVVVRENPWDLFGEIVVGFDGSAPAEAALEYAIDQARARRTRMHVVYAWHAWPWHGSSGQAPAEESAAARDRLAPWREKCPDIAMRESTVCDHPVAALVNASRGAEMLVVGSRGLGGPASAVLGSVSHGVLHHAPCPVAVVRPRAGGR
ncbi:universal stress protein [Thermoactinospora rubra]|uniref:universal stress protein n=1 Tax=Thermoactinospora rubra TaxID=1088767 RepID=UPI000A0F608F|nr:universal stress protein [Thermoactinospora rubra]